MTGLCLLRFAAVATTLTAPVFPFAGAQQVANQTKQTPTSTRALAPDERDDRSRNSAIDRTYVLRYQAAENDQREVLTALRNMLDPDTKIFLVQSSSSIVVHAPVEQQNAIAALLQSLDRSHPRYRLTYTVSEFDGTRKLGLQHFSLVLAAGQRGELKQGSRVPYSTGGLQYSYVDVGMNFDAALTEVQGGAVLKSKVDQTSVASESMEMPNPRPLIRQTTLTGTAQLLLSKPLLLGSLDVPGSTHRFEVEAVLEVAN